MTQGRVLTATVLGSSTWREMGAFHPGHWCPANGVAPDEPGVHGRNQGAFAGFAWRTRVRVQGPDIRA